MITKKADPLKSYISTRLTRKEICVDEKIRYIVDNLYLVGRCYLREDSRTFRLDRMKGSL